jgi:hypothetical protein
MRKFWFKLFGETNILLWFWGLTVAIYLTVIALIGWAAIHFIIKYW